MTPIWKDLKKAFGRLTGSESTAQESDQDKMTPPDQPNQPQATQERMVFCVKFQRELPGLAKPPFPGELGQRIYENISQYAFELWQQQQTLIINHYGLNLADPAAKEYLLQEMEAFLFHDQAHIPEGWIPEGQAAPGPQSKGGPPIPQGKGGAPPGPQSKGGPPVPPRKT